MERLDVQYNAYIFTSTSEQAQARWSVDKHLYRVAEKKHSTPPLNFVP